MPPTGWNLQNRIRLIPRNNWDYGFECFRKCLSGCLGSNRESPASAAYFAAQPIWTASGRASLYAILKALKLPSGSKVGVPLFCCPVVFDAIRKAGLVPEFLDSSMDTYTLSPDDFSHKRKALSAVIPVHLFGHPCAMNEINAIAGSLPVIEDCAQSLYSRYHGALTGFLSRASFFSFRCGKYISSGEGSAIFCSHSELKEEIQTLTEGFEKWSVSGMIASSLTTWAKASLYRRPWYGTVGYPLGRRLDKALDLTAKYGFSTRQMASSNLAIAESRIPKFEQQVNRQRAHAATLLNMIDRHDITLPVEKEGCMHNWYQFAIRSPDSQHRDAMAEHLFSAGIDTGKYLDTVVDEAVGHYGYERGSCPNAEAASRTLLLIPIHYTLSEGEIRYVWERINNFTAP